MTEPQHPECDVEHHLRGKGCGWMVCGVCGEEYDLGQKISRESGFHYWPDGEHAYYRHCRSERHDLAIRARIVIQSRLLTDMSENWDKYKAQNKLYRTPEMIALTRLLR